jgi:hypothetical protein
VATKTITLAVSKDARVNSAGGGAGQSEFLPVGLYAGTITRSLIQFTMPNWSGLNVVRIISATLKVRNSAQNYVARGASPRVIVQRATFSWSEGVFVNLSDSNGVNWANQPGGSVSDDVDSGLLSTSDFVWISIPITGIVQKWAPVSVEGGFGLSNYGIKLVSYDEGSTARTTEFNSQENPAAPYITLVYEDNSAPGAPIDLEPATNEDGTALVRPFVTAKTIRFAFTRQDVDSGDYITAAQIQIYADAATDAVPGSTLIDVSKTFSGSPTTATYDVDATALTVGTTYRARIRTRDKADVWGAWSSLSLMRFIPDTAPAAPSNLAVDVATQSPNFYGSLVDPDPSASIGAVRIFVYQDTTAGAILKWDSDWAAVGGGTRFTVSYGGSTLDYGTKYRWAAQVADNIGAQGPLSAYQEWTPVTTQGPDNLSPRTIESKVNTLTPTLTVGHSQTFTQHELQVARYPDPQNAGEYLWLPPVPTAYAATNSKAVTYAGSALTWGRTFYWRAKVFVGGTTWTEWSPWYPFYVNALPDKAVITVDNAVASGVGTYGTYVTVATTTPTLRAPFLDPDKVKGYTENPVRREIEIIRADTLASISGSPFVITSGITDTFTTAALTAGVTYKARVRYDDSASQRAVWSDYVIFKVSAVPSIGVGTAVDTTDPSPTLDWTLTGTQRRFRVLVYINATGELVHDSGLVDSSTTAYVLPGGILDTGKTYRWTVTAYDPDLLSATLT